MNAKNSRAKKNVQAVTTQPVTTQCDVLIVGAGAAGLACARELLDHKTSVVILEARDRVGGRVHTVRFSNLEHPIELGAEFVHGEARATFDLAEAFGLTFCDASELHLRARGSGKANLPIDFWDRIETLFAKLDPKRKPDRSIAAFLEAHRKDTDAETLELAAAFVEGFQAADLSVMGERGLAAEENSSGDESVAKAARLNAGYQSLIDSLVRSIGGLEGPRSIIRLGRVVKEIAWKGKGAGNIAIVTVRSSTGVLSRFRARKVVVTAPVSLLKTPPDAEGGIAFDPEPPGLKHMLSGVHMGHAMRMVFRFRSRFWEALAPKEEQGKIGYLHAGPEANFPTWWTSMPQRAPILTAWQGGPRAARLSLLPERERAGLALTTLSQLLGCDRARVEDELQSFVTHDWTRDPFALGAYSYIGVGGEPAAEALGRPIADTLYFAGEATAIDATRGTVEGALQSGMRAARQILKSL